MTTIQTHAVRGMRALARRNLLAVPVPRTLRARAREAQSYWSRPGPRWAMDSHFRDSGVPHWETIGTEHLRLFDEFCDHVGLDDHPARILEWGAGGGANAVAFAPRAREFVAVDVSGAALAECRSQVERTCATPVRSVPVHVDRPETALDTVADVDLFLCFYVLELVPSQHHARRIMATAVQLLRPGGAAVIQVKYRTGSWRTRSRTWGYRRQVAAMTTYSIDGFWQLAADLGFEGHYVKLVPENELDQRYAYFFLTRSGTRHR